MGVCAARLRHVDVDAEGLCGGDSARAWGSLGRFEAEPDGSKIFWLFAHYVRVPSTLKHRRVNRVRLAAGAGVAPRYEAHAARPLVIDGTWCVYVLQLRLSYGQEKLVEEETVS